MKRLERGFLHVWGTLSVEPWNFIASSPFFTPFPLSLKEVRKGATFPLPQNPATSLWVLTHTHLHVSTIFLGKCPSGHEISLYFLPLRTSRNKRSNFNRKLLYFSRTFLDYYIFSLIFFRFFSRNYRNEFHSSYTILESNIWSTMHLMFR